MRNEEDLILKWFKLKNWSLLPFQKEAWELILQGKSGMISVPTGAGKTYAAYLPALSKIQNSNGLGTKILYITPLKALAKDLEIALKRPIDDLNLPYRVEKRTGDTSFARKNKQKIHPPEILLTTPESLALMLTDNPIQRFQSIQFIIVDEWHELLGTKRGVLLELCLAKLKHLGPQAQIWGLTATIGNLHEAAQACIGMNRTPTLITANMKREVILNAILPKSIDKLPWAGHLGLHMTTLVLQELSHEHPTILFTNTRSQAERWYQAILEHKPEWKNDIGLHHSSIDLKTRESIEDGIKTGTLKFIVCTSSLDLGIDLPVVEKVIQIGSPKSIARLIQRAGRSSHKPLTPCHISLVPTHALEVIELEGYQKALQNHTIEEKVPLKKSYDALLQHLMTCAIGGGFDKETLYKEIKTTMCFSDLTMDEFEECLQILTIGGKALNAYPEYKKLILKEGLYRVEDPLIIRQHKMQIGTITSDPYVTVKLLKGTTIGSIEESFLTHLIPGDSFLFAGRCLKLVQYRDMTAHVRVSKELPSLTAVWRGGKLPFSASLGYIIRHHLGKNLEENAENTLLHQVLNLQKKISHLPHENELLIEIVQSREGWHLCIYPFEGKTFHEGLAMIIAHRLSKNTPRTFTISCNDYGFELLSDEAFEIDTLNSQLFSSEKLSQEIEEAIHFHEIEKRYFRDIARIAGFVFQGYPHKHKSNRQIQMTTGLIFDVLKKYEPDHLLLKEAKNEVLTTQLQLQRLQHVLQRLSTSQLVIKTLHKFSPFSLPLFVEIAHQRISTESLETRIQKIQRSWSQV